MSQADDIRLFKEAIDENRYNLIKLLYIIFPFGQKGHELENFEPYEWQLREWRWLSARLMNPLTRYEAIRIIISSGNGAAKTAWGAMTLIMLMYTQKLRGRITANTDPQMKQIVWPEYDKWLRHARYNEEFFEKLGTSIKAKDEKLADTWRLDTVTWDEKSPTSISGLHNKGNAIIYIFEEAPGIPAVVWNYASGAFTETETIKIFLAFGNSDDPESKFEQNMTSPLWHSVRIDTRTLSHIDPKQIEDWLMEANGDEDNDEFRVRVRGLPRKTAKDSIISLENVKAALERRKGFDIDSVALLPVILTVDPAWTGGDETVIAMRQGNYMKILAKYKLDKAAGETHMLTYNKLVYYEQQLHADAVFIDQGEGTTIYTLAMNNQKTSWELVSFASSANDSPEEKNSEYGNIRGQMYYEFNKWLQKGGVIDVEDEAWIPMVEKQLCWTKGSRHKITNKKLAEPKLAIKSRVGSSPDIADACVLTMARQVLERLPENDVSSNADDRFKTGQGAYRMPDHPVEEIYEADFTDLYGN